MKAVFGSKKVGKLKQKKKSLGFSQQKKVSKKEQNAASMLGYFTAKDSVKRFYF